jgi:predicted NACHT family NTPase
LSELVKQAEKSDNFLNSIPIIIKKKYPLTFPKIEDLFRDKLSKGQCLLLLDALDEVPKNSRLDLREKLNIWVKNYPCKLICTSRIVGYSSFVNDAKEVEIVPFSDRQTEAYINNWFTNAAPYLEDDSVSAEGLITELANKPQIQGLSKNPLLLSLLCSLYQTKDSEIIKNFFLRFSQQFRQGKLEAFEMVMALAISHAYGCYNPKQWADYLGIHPQKIYSEISKWTVYRLKKVLLLMMVAQAAEAIKEVKKKVLRPNQGPILLWQ